MNPTDVYNELMKYDNVVIAGHINPDGDAIGSALALGLILHEMGKETVVLLEEFADKYKTMAGQHLIYKGSLDDLNPDVFIAVDCGSVDRLGEAEGVFKRAKVTFNLDHHITNTNFANYNIVYTGASSTSEIMFDIVKYFSTIGDDIAAVLYAGIISDTNGFKNKATTMRTHENVAQLMRFDIPFTEIHERLLDSRTVAGVKILAKALSKFSLENGIAYTTITQEEIKQCGATDLDLDGIVETLLNIDTVEIALFLYEKNNGSVKASIRSRNVDVNEVAAGFGGGGHKLAAGASFDKPIDKVLEDVLGKLKPLC